VDVLWTDGWRMMCVTVTFPLYIRWCSWDFPRSQFRIIFESVLKVICASKEIRRLKVHVLSCFWFATNNVDLFWANWGLSQETFVPCGQRVWFVSLKKEEFDLFLAQMKVICSQYVWKEQPRKKENKMKKKVSKEKKRWLINKYWFLSIFTSTKSKELFSPQPRAKNYTSCGFC